MLPTALDEALVQLKVEAAFLFALWVLVDTGFIVTKDAILQLNIDLLIPMQHTPSFEKDTCLAARFIIEDIN